MQFIARVLLTLITVWLFFWVMGWWGLPLIALWMLIKLAE